MKKALLIIAVLVLMFSAEEFSGAKDKTSIAVLPFNVHSAENIDYVRSGIWDMLSSRISVAEKIEVIAKDAVLNVMKTPAGKELSQADAYALGQKMNVDYIVWGSITKIGNSLSIDGKLLEVKTNKAVVSAFVQSQGMDEVIPKINDFAQRIDSYILGSVPSAFGPTTSPAGPADNTMTQAPPVSREAEIIAGMKSSRKGTFTSAPINADFINSNEPIDRKGFWTSQKFSTTFKGMDVGDVNGDGLNEVVVIDQHNVMIYQKKGNELTIIQQIPGKSYDNYLALDVADINGNGVKEIIVTSINRNNLDSFVLEFKEGKFVEIASQLPWFLRVITDSTGMPLMLGQQRGRDDAPFNTPIYEMIWDNGKYRAGRKMSVPEGLPVYGLTLDTLGPGTSEKVIALDNYDYLNIYDKTSKALSKLDVLGGSKEKIWKSDDVFGGSNVFFETVIGEPSDKEVNTRAYINARILTADLNKDGKREILIVKNLSSLGRIMQNVKMFTSSEIYDLEWDGLGMFENWKTRKINGYVADYQFKDIDNDGQNEIVLALVLSVGISLQERSVIIFYKLNT